jgi:hypothetical protein
MKRQATGKSYSSSDKIRRAGLFGLGILILLSLLSLLFLVACSGDDGPTEPTDPTPAISIADQTAIEGNTLLFAVTLDQATSHAVIYSYTTTNITATSPADYSAASDTDTIAAGETSAIIMVTTIDDIDAESDETFSVSLTQATGATVARSLAMGTITDNDATGVSFATQVKPLLSTSCGKLGNCHGGQFPGGGFYIGTDAVYGIVVSATGDNTALMPGSPNGRVVQPGDHSVSTLFTKVDSTGIVPFASLMPADGSALSIDQQNLIRDWIDQGALDN